MSVRESLPISPDDAQRIADYSSGLKPEAARADPQPPREPPVKPPSEAPAQKNAWQESPLAKKLIEGLQGLNTELSVARDPNTNTIVVTILDSKTGETIRKLPLQDAISADGTQAKGLLLDITQ